VFFVYIITLLAAMFGCVGLKQIFRTPVKKHGNARCLDIARHASNNVVVYGRFIYLVKDNTIQVFQFECLHNIQQRRC